MLRTSFDLLSDGLIEPEGERGLGFFDWMLWVNAGLHNAQALHARYKRRAHLPRWRNGPEQAARSLRRYGWRARSRLSFAAGWSSLKLMMSSNGVGRARSKHQRIGLVSPDRDAAHENTIRPTGTSAAGYDRKP